MSLCWLFVQLFLLYRNGIKTDLESAKYIREADHILSSGYVSSPNFWFYSTQIFLVAFVKKLNIGYISVVAIQMFFNAFAIYRLFFFLKKHVTPTAALIAILLLIFNIPFNQYNTFLQTESLFHSFTILYIVYLLGIENLTVRHIIFITLFLLLLTFTRPTGILLYPASIIYILMWKLRNHTYFFKYGMTAALIIVFLLVLNLGMQSGGELNFMLPFQKEMIICGVPVREADIKITSNPNNVAGILYYISHNFTQFIILAWEKTISLFGVYRSYYSTINNWYTCGMFFLLYLLSAIGIKKWYRQNKGIALFSLANIFTTWLSVVFSCDDWHNRWLLTLVPAFIILACKGIEIVLKKF